MRVAVLGSGGLLGRHLLEELQGLEVRGFTRAELDISGPLGTLAERLRGQQVLINCAAFTNVDGAESDEAGAYRANALGAEQLALAARTNGSLLVHISTDFVFGGEKADPYDEYDTPRPLSVYARSKFAGEQLVLASGAHVILARVQGLYGAGGKNFSSKLADLIAAKKPLKLDRERRVQPTWARAVARQLRKLIERPPEQVPVRETFHVSCKGAATWSEVARRIATHLKVEPYWEEVPTSALKAPAARPANCLFAQRNLALRGLDIMPRWDEALDEFLRERAR